MNIKLALASLALVTVTAPAFAQFDKEITGGAAATAEAKATDQKILYKAAGAGDNKVGTVGDGTGFVASSFAFNLSANVSIKTDENATAVVVQTSNSRGRNNYAGSSEGGAVAQCGKPTTGSVAPTTRAPNLANKNGCTES